MPNLTHDAEWQDAYSHLRESLGLTVEEPVPEMPRAPATASVTITEEPAVEEPAPAKPTKGKKGKASKAKASKSKRKAPEKDDDVAMTAEAEDTGTDLAKKLKADGAPQANGNGAVVSPEEATLAHAKATAAYIPFLSAEYLLPPKMPSHEEMEQFLLDLRKKALVEEYFGDS